MRFGRILLSTTLLTLALTAVRPSLALSHARRGPTSPRLFSKRTRNGVKKASSQTTIAPERATEIQTALIKQGYMTGDPSGVWDSNTHSAMQKLQADNGWQTRLVPDSRAIIKLGLGPTQDNVGLLNAGPSETRSPYSSTY